MPAEWEGCSSVILAFPPAESDWKEILPEAREQFARLIMAVISNGEKATLLCDNHKEASEYLKEWCDTHDFDPAVYDRIEFVELPLNDTWTRDYGPITVETHQDNELKNYYLDFGFNAWGGKYESEKDNKVNSHLVAKGVLPRDNYVDCRSFILEGGSLESDGKGTLLTTTRCLTEEHRNPRLTRNEIEKELKYMLGFERVLWLNHGYLEGDDTDSHIDTLCRFAPYDTILYTGSGDSDRPEHAELEMMRQELKAFRTADGKPYNLIELPLPDPVYGPKGERYPATYANFLVTEHNIFMPVYHQQDNDRMAMMTLQAAFDDRRIVPVDCRTLVKQGGSLHCSTMQLPS